MAGHEPHIVSQGDQFPAYGLYQVTMVAPGKVGTSDAALEQHVADEGESIDIAEEHHMTGGVAGTVEYVQDEVAHRDLVAVLQPLARQEGGNGGETEHLGLAGEPLEEKGVLGMRAQHLYPGQGSNGPRPPHVVDVAMGKQDLFQADTFPTPPFAEFTSGHSAFSMAAAVVLRRFTGSDVFGASYTQPGPLRAEPSEQVGGIVMSWPTFTAAAQEAGESRLYGGIHFYEGNVVGLDLGRRCGDAAYARAQDLWSGA